MRRLKALVVDDEPLSARRLQRLLTEIASVEVVGVASDGVSALAQIARLRPDVVLLDIEMPGLDGLALAQSLTETGPAIIFVTAFSRHAAEAFDLAAADYILKPVEIGRLREALARAERRLGEEAKDARIEELTRLVGRLGGSETALRDAEPSLWVVTGRTRTRVPLQSIEWIAAERDYVRLHTSAGSWLHRETLGHIMARLDPAAFLQVHRSAVVRLAAIRSVVRARSGAAVVLESGATVPVSRRMTSRLQTLRPPKADAG